MKLKINAQMLALEADELLRALFPLHRSLAGSANRQTLLILQSYLPSLRIHEVPSGTKAFDWTVPKEWNVQRAYVKEVNGEVICDISNSNLHVVAYSQPVHKVVELHELRSHLHWHSNMTDAIPYVTSYYRDYWGFCLTKDRVDRLKEGRYEVCIESQLTDGAMSYGELLIKGKSPREIVFSTYICHPSMANNELSGPVLQALLARLLVDVDLNYSYRFLFLPETIGSIYYLSRNLTSLRQQAMAIFSVTCVGDAGPFSYLSSRGGDTYADRLIQHVGQKLGINYVEYSWLERGSDERQYGAPTINLPVASLMRTKYGEYPEYHTSHDNLDLVSGANIVDTLRLYTELVSLNEDSSFYVSSCNCEPMLSPRGLYPSISNHDSAAQVYNLLNVLSYADGISSQHDIAQQTGLSIPDVNTILSCLSEAGVLSDVSLKPLPCASHETTA